MNEQMTIEREKRGGSSGAAHGSAYGVQRISKFLRVVSDPSNPSERGVMSNDNKLIAILGYYKPWRQWVLYPQPNTVWSTDCLAAINAHLAVLGSRPNADLRQDAPSKPQS
jgi:hypothetical protein